MIWKVSVFREEEGVGSGSEEGRYLVDCCLSGVGFVGESFGFGD